MYVCMYVYMELYRAVRKHHIGDPQEGSNVGARVQISSGVELLYIHITYVHILSKNAVLRVNLGGGFDFFVDLVDGSLDSGIQTLSRMEVDRLAAQREGGREGFCMHSHRGVTECFLTCS